METTKISYQKIAVRTLIKLLLMSVLLLLFNSWAGIKQSINGNIPPLSYWFGYILKWDTIIPLLIFGAYFYYQDLRSQKELIENEKKIIEKHNSWIEAE